MKELRRIRKARRLSQRRLAELSGVGEATIADAERGRHVPWVHTLEKLATALEVEVGDFFPKAQGELPLNFDGQRAAPLEDFGDSIRDLDLDALSRLGHELRREHREATDAGDWERAGELYARRGLLWERIQELDPPLCQITTRADGPTTITFYRDPTEEEEVELSEKYGDYVANRDLVPAL